MKPAELATDVLAVVGLGLVAVGLWWVLPALALIVVGLALLGLGLWRAR
jgi:hypothetical protein